MLTFGIHTREQYLKLGERRRYSGARVAYNLLRTSTSPTPEEISIFEDICFTLRTSNGTFRTTFRNRFPDLDAKVNDLLQRLFKPETPLRIQDRAVSSGLTSYEWAKSLFDIFPRAELEASDLLFDLREIRLQTGETYITEPNGHPLQYIKPPYVVSLDAPESWRNPWLRWVAGRAKDRYAKLSPEVSGSALSCIHPEAAKLARTNPQFRFQVRSVFDATPAGCEVVRTMNVLNQGYFTLDRLAVAVSAIFASVVPGGVWIVGRTLEEDFTNHATIFRRDDKSWTVLDRLGRGSEIEELALSTVPAP